MTDNRITELFSKKLAKEATAEELQELEEYLSANPGEQYFQKMVTNWWNPGKADDTKIDSEQEEHFKYILWRADESNEDGDAADPSTTPVVKIRRRKYWRVALAAAAVAGIVFFSTWKIIINHKAEGNTSIQENEIVARRGTKSKIILPDGTKVWLNSESRLVYDNAFNGRLREVTLEGEAYFDVVKNPKRPFIVHTSGINIRVLGTAFNVKSYPLEPTIEATLVRGLIEVEKNNQPQSPKILLHPNEKLVYTKIQEKIINTIKDKERDIAAPVQAITLKPQSISISTLPKNIVDSSRLETSWVYGRFLFEGDTFSDLAKKMERWFNVSISFRNNKVANYRFRGVWENENIEEALQALQLTAPFKYSISGNEVVIDKK